MRVWILLLAVVACSPPDRPDRPRRPRPDDPVVASSDRAHPTQLAVKPSGNGNMRLRGEILTRAPGPGTWWYVVEFPREPGHDTDIEISASQAGVALAWVDTKEQILESPPGQKIALPPMPAVELRILIRATTDAATTFRILAIQDRFLPKEPPSPPCDPDHIDRSNPKCARVHPICDRANPDFSNPRCCDGLGTRSTQIVSGERSMFTIALGTTDGIMRGARGWIERGGNDVSAVQVVDVSAHQALIQVSRPAAIDASKLGEMRVVLEPPSQCAIHQRRGL